MSSWFYADHSQQRRGPVTEDQLRTAYQQQQIAGTSLVWTEGMAGWQPLANVLAQLGITAAAGPPPMPFGATQPALANANGTVLAKSSGSNVGWVIAAIVGVCGLVFFLILAAIAIPAYRDYTVRARLMGVIYEVKSQRILIEEFYQVNQTCPVNSDMNFPKNNASATDLVRTRDMSSPADGSCALTYAFMPTAVPGSESHTLTMVRESEGKWRYESTIPLKYLPADVRNGMELN